MRHITPAALCLLTSIANVYWYLATISTIPTARAFVLSTTTHQRLVQPQCQLQPLSRSLCWNHRDFFASAITIATTSNGENNNSRGIITTAAMSSNNDNIDNNDNSKEAGIANAIDFLTMARGLKTTKRTGWVMRKVPNVESVADHSWRITLMSMIAASSTQSNIDANKCIQMALVHDLAEAAVGDITPHCGVSDTDKHQLELNAITKMTGTLAPFANTCAATILALWKEYEQGTTMEAKLVKDMDKLEMILQALEYEQEHVAADSDMMPLDQFFTSTRGKWRTELGAAWAAEIESRRKPEDSKEA